MRTYLFFMLFIIVKTSLAQGYSIHGRVSDAVTKLPLQGVMISASNKGTYTDEKGLYHLAFDSVPPIATFRLIGYQTQKITLAFSQKEISIDVQLKPGNTNLEEVVVTASKYEQKIAEVTTSIEILKPKLIEASGNSTMETAMEQVSGVNVIKSEVNIRGGSGFSYGTGSRVLMLVDDLPILSADAGDIKWDFLPTENVQQVEVIKGASSALFGSSALGGVINLRTGYAKEQPETKIRVFTGVFDNYENDNYNFNSSPIFNHGIYASHSRIIKNHDLVLTGALVLDNEYRQDEYSKYARFTTNYKYHFKKIRGLNAGANFNIYSNHYQTFLMWKNDSNPSISADGTLTRQYATRFYLDPFITYISPGGHKHSFRNRYFFNNIKGADTKKNDSRSDFIYNEYQYQKAYGDTSGNEIKFTLGLVNNYSRVISDSIYGNKTAENAAAYMQTEYKLKRIIFSIGTRAEYFRTDTLEKRFIKVLRAGFNWHIAVATFLRASIGEGYRMPAIAELYASTSSGALAIFPNPNLQPESGWGTEAGIKQGFLLGTFKGMIDVALFRTEYKNMIEFIFGYYPPYPNYQGNPFPFLGFKALNYTNARISGIETTFAAEGKIKNSTLTITGGFTKISPLNLDSLNAVISNNKFLKYRYNNLLRVNADLECKSFSAGTTVRYNSFMTNIDEAFNIILPGVKNYREKNNKGDWIMDFRVSYKIKKFNSTIALIIKNITNHEYMFAPANLGPPRYFMMQYNVIF
jgi:outer membrane cobalamin receptor